MNSTPREQPPSHALEGWTRLLAEGDDAAWRWFHDRYYPSLLRYAAHRCGTPSAASEIVQDTYLRIARHAKPFTREADFWGWLCCIVRCVAIDYSRQIKRRSLLMEKYSHWRASQSDDETAWHPSKQDNLALIDEALAKLPDEDATLLRRKYCEGSTTDELASALGTTSKAVEHRLARLRKQLREIILLTQ
jgi:RNA polymerase sigma-70 factor (ECF subfamily)